MSSRVETGNGTHIYERASWNSTAKLSKSIKKAIFIASEFPALHLYFVDMRTHKIPFMSEVKMNPIALVSTCIYG
jgi:hypothetical protein